jgi:hypothetical protein
VTPRIIVTPDFPKKTKHSLYVAQEVHTYNNRIEISKTIFI